ncbi:acyl-CoA carboxylase subunit epsilon [Streptomyces carpinensis]|uniref:Acyl-CoA carboxylase subunit epsilon n=1 Tax=Streptomyces carpinensis TaxID=66369 RepID=A0ABV1VX08_9ACTN|nr:acyl-CoA carboxylase subunit epsilon [Streptomyces carpinensis]
MSPTTEALVRIVRGTPDPEAVAAITLVLLLATAGRTDGDGESEGPPAAAWGPARGWRPPGSWTSA